MVVRAVVKDVIVIAVETADKDKATNKVKMSLHPNKITSKGKTRVKISKICKISKKIE